MAVPSLREDGNNCDADLSEQDRDGSCSMDRPLPPLLKLISTQTYPFLANDIGKYISSLEDIEDQSPGIHMETNDSPFLPCDKSQRFGFNPESSEREQQVALIYSRQTLQEENSTKYLDMIVPQNNTQIVSDFAGKCNFREITEGTFRTSPVERRSPVEGKIELPRTVLFRKDNGKFMKDDMTQQSCFDPIANRKSKRCKRFYSQQIPVKSHAIIMDIPQQYSGPLLCRNSPKQRADFSIFKTKSVKLERQISRLQFRRQEDGQQQQRACITEAESALQMRIPAGRYFAALTGPEFEHLRDTEQVLLPLDRKWPFLLRFPIGCFRISLGLGSQTILWKTLASTNSVRFLHTPKAINLILWCLSLITLMATFITYSLKCIFYLDAVRREYYHPVRMNFFFTPWIACMFLTLGVPPIVATSAHPVLWCLFMAPIFLLELKIYGQWLSGGQRNLSKVANPSTHLSVLGNFVGAELAATVGWKELAVFFWSVGLAHYLVVFVTLYQQLPTAQVLPKELHPVFFLFVATPSVASISWENIVGDFDLVSRIAFFVGLFLYSSLVVRLNFFRGSRFSVAWWAYTFPTSASAIAAIHYSHKITSPITQGVAVILSFISALMVFTLFVSTILHAFVWGTMFPNDLAIAITPKPQVGNLNSNGHGTAGPVRLEEVGLLHHHHHYAVAATRKVERVAATNVQIQI